MSDQQLVTRISMLALYYIICFCYLNQASWHTKQAGKKSDLTPLVQQQNRGKEEKKVVLCIVMVITAKVFSLHQLSKDHFCGYFSPCAVVCRQVHFFSRPYSIVSTLQPDEHGYTTERRAGNRIRRHIDILRCTSPLCHFVLCTVHHIECDQLLLCTISILPCHESESVTCSFAIHCEDLPMHSVQVSFPTAQGSVG